MKVIDAYGRTKVTAPTAVMPPAGSVYGFNLKYLSTTSISVAPGQALDNTQTQNITLGSTQTISTGTLGAVNGLDQTAIVGTVATNSANATVTGTGTAFLTAFGVRTGTGTYSVSTTTVTGVGTKFLSEVSVNDLIGDPVNGFACVTAVNSDTSIKLAVTTPNGSASALSFQVIENVHFQAGTNTVSQVNSITSNTTLTLSGNSSATASGVTAYIGALPAVQTYLMVWVGQGTSGTGVWLSTQRTTPYAPSGYGSYVRRVGSISWNGTTPTIIPFDQYGQFGERWYQFECGRTVNNLQIATGTIPASWTSVVCSGLLPPTAVRAELVSNVNSGAFYYLRARNAGTTDTTRPRDTWCQSSGAEMITSTAIDGGQAFDYLGSGTGTIWLSGYQESLALPSLNTNTSYSSAVKTSTTSNLTDVYARLTLTQGTPVTTSDVTGATAVYLEPYGGNTVAVYDGVSGFYPVSFASGLSVAVPATTNTPFDIFCYDSGGGVLTLETVNWTNTTTRATALTTVNGVYVKSGATTHRYLGTGCTTGVSGQCEDSGGGVTTQVGGKRFLWNAYNRKPRQLVVKDTTASWSYTSTTWRQADGASGNKVEYVCGLVEEPINVLVGGHCGISSSSADASVGVGIDSTSVNSANVWPGDIPVSGSSEASPYANYRGFPGVGYHYVAWLESTTTGGGTVTWIGFSSAFRQSGMTAEVWA